MKTKIYLASLALIISGLSPALSQDIYEPNNTYETATVVTCGQQLSAYIQVEDDVDWYEIEMAESGVLEVSVTSVPDNINMNVEVHMLDENVLTLIADDRVYNPGLGESMLAVAVVDAGTYFIKVVDRYNDAYSDTDPYELELTCTPNALELNQVYEEAAPIALDTCFEANIYGDNHLYTEPQDVDWYEVYTENPGVLEVAVTSVPDNLNINVEVYQLVEDVLTL
ncbi:MAG: PPC domain-containing protein, partial [Bacteroidales bacterium]|nr:PPC domain-containing protein [Bacteroidales bacterium]